MKLHHIVQNAIKLIIAIPFGICVLFLNILGWCVGLNYKQISVYFNLYFQGIILAFSSLLPVGASIYAWCTSAHLLYGIMLVCTLLYFSIYVVGLIWMIRHYSGSTEQAFDLCVSDLKSLAKKWSVSYMTVNLIIFVGWWLALFVMNLTLAISISQTFFPI